MLHNNYEAENEYQHHNIFFRLWRNAQRRRSIDQCRRTVSCNNKWDMHRHRTGTGTGTGIVPVFCLDNVLECSAPHRSRESAYAPAPPRARVRAPKKGILQGARPAHPHATLWRGRSDTEVDREVAPSKG